MLGAHVRTNRAYRPLDEATERELASILKQIWQENPALASFPKSLVLCPLGGDEVTIRKGDEIAFVRGGYVQPGRNAAPRVWYRTIITPPREEQMEAGDHPRYFTVSTDFKEGHVRVKVDVYGRIRARATMRY